MSETARLADQIRRAFEGETWTGDPLFEILKDVTGAEAAAKPIPNAHSIWELVVHITTWDRIVAQRTGGTAVVPTDEENFPTVKDTSETAWRKALEQCKTTHNALVKAVAGFPDSRLSEQVPGKREAYYNFYFMFAGIAQHELYHAGQIALLKKFH
ncbi:MAG TPA: DinB family protein [Terriglobales bacterium]|nr:DinB family protein [Terriglobales bacterium]